MVAAVAEDLAERQRDRDEYLAEVMKRIDTLEAYYLSTNKDTHNND